MKHYLASALLAAAVLAAATSAARAAPASIAEAYEVLRQGTWIDLTHAVNADIPRFGAFPALQREAPYTLEKDGFLVYQSTFVTQYGTHLDAPSHFVAGRRSLEQIEVRELMLPLVVINKEEEVRRNPDYILSREDVLEWERQHGEIAPGSFVAFATGWSRRWGQEDFSNADAQGVPHTPGWSIEALEHVLKVRGATAVGHETFDTDAAADVARNGFFASEKFVLSQDKYQLELMNNLTSLPATGGIIVIGVPRFEGYPGFPVRAFAIVP